MNNKNTPLAGKLSKEAILHAMEGVFERSGYRIRAVNKFLSITGPFRYNRAMCVSGPGGYESY
ncbi:hypothetical protein [Paenibacillus sp. 7516]|uniref:hypothetical protein n=1 Tax=Paenibacillus sp. 7516 TaxID=2022549 RepID=UPI000BDB4B74|nr:hypothetical protein [Paenibacillus sp. 7516]PAF29738.1 hypothetical protein CHI14_20510 [Paenibacillus sp. 7516]